MKPLCSQSQPSRVLSQWSHTGHTYFLQQWVVAMYVKCCLPGKLITNSLLRIFTGGWACRHPLPGMYQNLRLPEGKQVFIINHNVCTNSLDAVGHSCQGVVRTFLPGTHICTCQPMASFSSKPFLRTAVSGQLCHLFPAQPRGLRVNSNLRAWQETDSRWHCAGVPSSSHAESKILHLKTIS